MDQQASCSIENNSRLSKNQKTGSVSAEIADSNDADLGEDFMSNLPHEMLVNIFSLLDFKMVSRCAMVCKSFHRATQDSMLYKHILLEGFMSNAMLSNYTSKVSRPKTLDVEYYPNTPETVFDGYVKSMLAAKGQYLSVLKIVGCRSRGIFNTIPICSDLTSLHLHWCNSRLEMLHQLNNLKDLWLMGTTIEDRILDAVLKNNRKIKTLRLNHNQYLTTDGLADTLKKYNTLIEHLYISFEICDSQNVIEALGRCNKLHTLRICFFAPTQFCPADSLQQLATGCPLLKSFSITRWTSIKDEHLLTVLASCKKITDLVLWNVGISIKTCKEAAVLLPKLKVLDVSYCKSISKEEIVTFKKDPENVAIEVICRLKT